MQPLTEYVEKRIRDLFEDIAVQVGSGAINLSDYTEDECASIPMVIFRAENHMVNAWRELVASSRSESVCVTCGGLGQVRRPLDYEPRYRWEECPDCLGGGEELEADTPRQMFVPLRALKKQEGTDE